MCLNFPPSLYQCRDSQSFLCSCHTSKRSFGLPALMLNFSRNTILHLADVPACFLHSNYHTSICHIKLNAKVSLRSSGVVAGSEDDATDGFVFPDHAGDGRRGHYPMVSNDQTADLQKCHTGVFWVGWDECASQYILAREGLVSMSNKWLLKHIKNKLKHVQLLFEYL